MKVEKINPIVIRYNHSRSGKTVPEYEADEAFSEEEGKARLKARAEGQTKWRNSYGSSATKYWSNKPHGGGIRKGMDKSSC